MRVRLGEKTDVPALVPLINEAYQVEAHFVEGDRIDAASVEARFARGDFLVVEDGGRGLLGCVFVEVGKEPGYFGLLSVSPRAQGQGWGRRLVALAEAHIAAAGRRAVSIEVVSQRPELYPFYGSLGYAPTGETTPFPEGFRLTKPGHCVLFRRSLTADGPLFGRHGRDFLLDARVLVPRPLAEVFPFFAHPQNLDALTPPWLSFRILTPPPLELRAGAIFDYRLRLHGLPLSWRTEITACEPPHRFVDVQRRGPYREWRHEHLFTETHAGTLLEDRVRYRMWGGRVAHALFVRHDLERIFRFRQEAVRARFGPR